MKKRKSPASVQASVQRALVQELDVDDPRVSLVGDVAHLEGTVPSYQRKTMAAATVRLLTGASRVANRLRVAPSRSTGDRELRKSVLEALRAQLKNGAGELSVLVREGVVELKGTLASLGDRCAAESAAWSVGGVIDVLNRLQVRGHTSSPESLARQLRQSLGQCLRLDTAAFEVMARGDIIYLRGRVPSPYHRQAAEDLVRAHSQVRDVVNDLSVQEAPATMQPPQSNASA